MDLAKKKFAAGKPMRLYLGIDPTGSNLHLGHSVPLLKLKAFQDAGHEVIFLVGSFTAMIGDPSGQDTMREPLTPAEVKKNFADYKKQASAILDFKKTKVVYNDKWLSILSLKDMVGLASNFTVQQMLERDMFQERLKGGNPIALHEFLYPLMVGYDSVMLDVDFEVGGNDQYFNMLAGRALQKAMGKREKFVLTTKLIEGTDGRKMSKSYNNCIYLTDEPNDMYGKVMSIKDDLMPLYFECCTELSMDEIHTIFKGTARDAKARLALEITKLYHGEKNAEEAQKHFESVFKDKEEPEDIAEVKVKKKTPLVDVLVAQGLVASKSEARRLIEQKGIKVNGKPVQSVDAAVVETWTVKVGKRKFIRLKIS